MLEHQGNNRLGGKDIDKLIAETFFVAPLAASFNLPDAESDAQAHKRLMRALVRHAEQAKIALSTAAEATAEIFDVGEDKDGKPIEAVITVKRSELEAKITAKTRLLILNSPQNPTGGVLQPHDVVG